MSSRESPIEYAYDGNQDPSQAVVAAVAATFDRDPREMEPLYEYVDPDALNAVFPSHPSGESDPGDVRIGFHVDAGHVTVTADHVRVRSSDDA